MSVKKEEIREPWATAPDWYFDHECRIFSLGRSSLDAVKDGTDRYRRLNEIEAVLKTGRRLSWEEAKAITKRADVQKPAYGKRLLYVGVENGCWGIENSDGQKFRAKFRNKDGQLESLTPVKMAWQDSYLTAWRFAAEAHQGQLFPGTDLPYIVHISAVAMEVIAALPHDEPDDPALAIQCALLHDVVEDAEVSLSEISQKFSDKVAAGVAALSKNPCFPNKKDAMRDSLERIQQQPREIWMVKMADRITNLQPPPKHWNPEKCSRYREEAEEILKKLGSASDYL